MNYHNKYIKYKTKYLNFKKNKNIIFQSGGVFASEYDLISLFNESDQINIIELLNQQNYNQINILIENLEINKKPPARSILSQLKLPDEIKIRILKKLPTDTLIELLFNPINKEVYRIIRDFDVLKDIIFPYNKAIKFTNNIKEIIYGLDQVTDTAELQNFTRLKNIIFKTTFNQNLNWTRSCRGPSGV